ncbi:acyl-CoA ligase (AMP-forming), exosortase A system-associated [Aquisalimonas asiatica]|uniref:Acyl-CoA ligase (AMP-forming), exosortase A-associated n=1 Tax=Aquisalimonas asiatica TaxID=406100 RepID=A0A1H8U6G1_9GAMM|nr:acyl-CoA ligase (AMP-forming), exosortase A system-associated [Aquisalimonas asiatica]SEO98443.1 acyl-CoA ligase (AMP-forming), exosortase A-associated [Aquisalimonas asiatica]
MTALLHDIPLQTATRTPDAVALRTPRAEWSYGRLADTVCAAAAGLHGRNVGAGDRVAVYLEKRPETVAALFAITCAGGIAVPVNPALKPAQVRHILQDCGARGLITSAQRLTLLRQTGSLDDLPIHDERLIAVDGDTGDWSDLCAAGPHPPVPERIETDPALILYTSGSTGQPKGVTLSHRNLVAGVDSVVDYLGVTSRDHVLAALPLSFDYGWNQVTTALRTGATVFLCDYLWPRELLRVIEEQAITALAGVPPLWNQLIQTEWPDAVAGHLRYITNSGGKLPRRTLETLQARLPETDIVLMYGLTEAFRSTYLPPEELQRRPDSMGRAIPNARVMVVRPDGSPCRPGETGELVHAGPLVSLGYWNDAERTAERFRPAPDRLRELPLGETAVWSGDLVTRDDAGYFYFVGRHDDMIKTSGYRVSPTEVEDVLHASGHVHEAVALGVPHPVLGEAILAVVCATAGEEDPKPLQAACQRALPRFMVPADYIIQTEPLPRGPNGKIDRSGLRDRYAAHFQTDPSDDQQG